MARLAFTLVELAIVLVIIGLIVGGIVGGAALIRSGELRAITTEHQRTIAAVQNFRAKYSALPGDMKNATTVWGDDNATCADAAITNGSPGTCNGNNDVMMTVGAAGDTSELYQFWKQLGLADFIGGYFTGLAGAGGAYDSMIGTNVPDSKLSGAGWSVSWLAPDFAGDASAYALDYGNYLVIGHKTTNDLTHAAAISPQDAYDLDSKLDDGKPASGSVIARFWDDACASADDAGSADDDLAASYRTTDQTSQCALYFRKAF